MRLVSALVLLAVCLGGAQRNEKNQRGAAVEVVETHAHRTSGGTIHLDGRVRNTGDRPISGLVIVFDFLEPNGAVISTQKFATDEDGGALERGDEAVFQAKINDHVRAVHYRIAAVDKSGRDLRVAGPGPYAIE
jgi:hypothetical protein